MSEPYILDWTKQLGSIVNDSANSVAIDSNNNVYITGYTSGDLDGNTNAGPNDIFLTKYESDGTKQWTKQLGTTVNDIALGVAIDLNNNVYITGYTASDLDGNTNAGSIGTYDAFLAKYESDGTKQWTKQLGTTVYDVALGVAIDSNNNVFITGRTGGDLDGNTNAGPNDIFLTKYESDGTKQWTKQLGSDVSDIGNCISIDSNNNVYITGSTGGDLDGNTNMGLNDVFLAKYVSPVAPVAPVVSLDASVITDIENNVPDISDMSSPVISIDVPDTILISGDETEKSIRRGTFLAKLFSKNEGLASAPGKIKISREKLLGASTVITKNTMVIKNASNTDVAQDTSQLAADEAMYVYMSKGDYSVFNTTGGNLKIVKTSETLYTIYENYEDSNSPISKIMNVGESSSLGTFTYVVGGVSGQINSSSSAAPICFPAGTPVTTNQGIIAIEKLNPDIHTIINKRIIAITQTRPFITHIVSIEKDALGKNVPSVTTQISKEHRVFYKGKMVRAVDLVKMCKGVVKIPYNGEMLYNVLLEKHSHMMINNLVCETLHPHNIMAKICGGKYNSSEQNKLCEELTNIIKTNNIPAYKKLYASLK